MNTANRVEMWWPFVIITQILFVHIRSRINFANRNGLNNITDREKIYTCMPNKNGQWNRNRKRIHPSFWRLTSLYRPLLHYHTKYNAMVFHYFLAALDIFFQLCSIFLHEKFTYSIPLNAVITSPFLYFILQQTIITWTISCYPFVWTIQMNVWQYDSMKVVFSLFRVCVFYIVNVKLYLLRRVCVSIEVFVLFFFCILYFLFIVFRLSTVFPTYP